MVLDTLNNMGLYEKFGDDFKLVSDYLKKTDLKSLEEGKYTLENGVYFMVQRYCTKPVEQGKWEAHRKYIDIQLILEGCEAMGYAPIEATKELAPYDEEKDFHHLQGEGCLLQGPAGSFCIFFPDDAHMPGINGSGEIRKIVVKIPVR